jgi:hypothetical protein
MSFIVLPSTITNPQNIPVTITADSTAPLYASLTYTWTITDLDSYVTYTVSTTNGTVSRTGGTISYTPASTGSGGFTINNRSIPLTISANPSPSYLLIGGGGAGGRGSPAGGGGAGGYLTGTMTVTPGTPLTITVGAGGSGAVGSYQAGNPGNTTVFSTVSVIGGGGSAGEKNQGQTGYASGGGGGGFVSMYHTGIAGTAGIGNSGGDGDGGGGGGGGALGAGETTTPNGGYGGNGYVLTTLYPTVTSSTSQTIGTGSFTFTVASGLHYAANQNLRIGNGSNYMYGLVTSYSGTSLVFQSYFVSGSGTFSSWTINNMYAGGGGGGGISVYGYPGGRGGTGNVTGYGTTGGAGSGAANSGGGGGGGSYANNSGGDGGSGVVIIRTASAVQATTGSPIITTEGSFYIYTFTGSGTITF